MNETCCAACGRPIPKRYLRVHSTDDKPICLPCMRQADAKLVGMFESAAAQFRRVFGHIEFEGETAPLSMPPELSGKDLSIDRTVEILRRFPDDYATDGDGKQEVFEALIDGGAILRKDADRENGRLH